MSIEEKIKTELLQEINSDIDKIYDFTEQRFALSNEHHDLLIKQLNTLKDQLYLIVTNNRLS